MASFIFGGDTKKTPESIKRDREIARALLASRAPRNVGEGISAIGDGIVAAVMNNRADKAESAGGERAAWDFAPLLDAGMGGGMPSMGSSPGATNVPGSSEAAGMPTTDISGSKEEFVNSLLPAAIEESKRTGIDPRIIVAQAAQETGWGKSAPGNNFFGIKSHGKGGGQNLTTHEVINGQRVKINDSFRTFESPADSVRGYGDFMLQNPRYKSMREAGDIDSQLEALGASGYATDPNYAASVGSIARGIRLPDVQPQNAAQATDIMAGQPQAMPQPVVPQPTPPQPMPPQQPQMSPQAQNARGGIMEALMGGGAQQGPTGLNMDYFPAAPNAPGQQGPSRQQIIRALTNPNLSPEQRAVAMDEYERMRQMNDPSAQLDMEYKRAQLDQLRNPVDKPTESMRNLEWRAEQAGLQPGTQEYRDFVLSGGSKDGVTVNVGQGSSKYNDELDKRFAEQYITMQEGAQSAQGKLATLQGLQSALEQSSFTGMGAETLLGVKQAARSLGIDLGDNLGPEETARALGNQLALQMRNPSSGAGMPGAMSDKDREFLVASVPGLSKTPEGNRQLVNFMTQIEQRNIQVAQRAQEYADRNGQIDNGFYKELSAWSEQNPLFPEEKQQQAPATQPTIQPGTIDGEYRFKGGDPSDQNNWERVM